MGGQSIMKSFPPPSPKRQRTGAGSWFRKASSAGSSPEQATGLPGARDGSLPAVVTAGLRLLTPKG